MFQALDNSLQAWLQELHACCVLWSPELDTVFQVRLHQHWGGGSPPLTCWQCRTNSVQDTLGLLGYKNTLLAHRPRVLLHRAGLQQVSPSLYQCLGLFLLRCRTLCLPLLDFRRFTSLNSGPSERPRSEPLWVYSIIEGGLSFIFPAIN